MANRPLLLLPSPQREPRPKRPPGGGPSGLQFPSSARQIQRLSPRIEELEDTFEAHLARIQLDSAAIDPERVLVLEVAGTVPEFLRAVRNTPGMEWLVESDEFDSDPDEDFRKSTAHPESAVPTRLYFVMADRQSIKELERLWKLYAKHAEGEEFKWPRGQTLWRDMFSHLKDIHFWGPEERVPDSLLTDWQQRLGQGADTVLAQIELWFRDDRAIRERAENSVVDLVGRAGGEVLARSIIPAISYHAILASLPRATVSQVVQHEGVALTLADGIMFLNAVGQSCFPVSDTDVSVQITTPPSDLPSGNPRLAILDGLPLSKHALLDGRLQEDDPEDWSSGYPAAVRQHGTAMASIAIHGDLSSPFTPLSTPVYIRPVMKPRETVDGQEEAVPEDELDVDLLHRAIRRLFQPTPTEPAAAPSVKIINYSICNRNRPFDRLLSPMAHLLDWLAFTYNFLPIISAGNCPRDIDLPCSPDSFRSLAPEEQDKTIVSALWNDAPNRRILAPAEAVNAISVAALHTDSSVASRAQAHISDVLTSAIFPSPINPLGFGYRRAIKPDVLAPGGRLLYEDAYPANTHAIKPIVESVLPPGIRVASPGKIPGNLTVESHTRGTSNSAALVSSLATRVCELLDHFAEPIPDDYLAVIIKAFVVHSARWPDCQQALTHLGPSRQVIPRFAGYGAVDYDRALFCTDERVTLFRWGILGSDESDLYSLPLPPALSGKRIAKRLTVTLAWLTPINCQHRYYRRAALSFQPEHLDLLDLDRSGVDFNFAGRGTVQHEVFEGRRAAPFLDGSSLTLRVNCRAHAGDLDDQIRYGIVVTLETADPHPIPIYDEIDIRIRPAIRV